MTAAVVLLFLFSGLFWLAPLLSEPTGVLFWRGGAYTDLLISHWTNAGFVRQSLTTWGQIPLWNPLIMSGAPFAADPLSGLFYLPNWLSVAIDPGIAYGILAWLHIAWGGVGVWKLSRTLGASSAAALVAGLAFSGLPKLIGHIGLGHVSLVFAVYWTPWVLLAFDRAIRELRAPSSALAGATLGLVFLIDPRWFLPMALFAGSFSLWRAWHGQRRWLAAALVLVGAGAMSAAIAAILAVPLAEFISLSTRAGITLEQSAALSLPPEVLLNLIAPRLAGWPEWQIYAGSVILFLALVALPTRVHGRWFWWGTVLICLVVALGDAMPLYGIARSIVPGFAQLRVPPRSLFLSSFVLSMLAGMGVDKILRGRAGHKPLRILGTVFAATALGLAVWAWFGNQDELAAATYFVSALLIVLSVLWTTTSERRSSHWSIAGWCLLIVFDLGLVNLSTVEARPRPEIPDTWVSILPNSPRSFSPSYSFPQPETASRGVEIADGINPLQLASYVEYMAEAAGFSPESYSVTLPPFSEGDPNKEWGFAPDPILLGQLSVSTVVSSHRLTNSELAFEGMDGGAYVYTNPNSRPRAWIENGNSVDLTEWTPNRIRLRAEGPGRLVLSEIAYPGWRVSIDGARGELVTFAGLLRAVQLDSGDHEIEFLFQPASLQAGALITLLGLAVLGSLWFRR